MKDGVGASACDGFAEANFHAWATALQASPGAFGYLSTLQCLGGCALQLWSEKLVVAFGSRKRFVVTCVTAQAALLSAMIVLALRGSSAWAFLALVLGFTVIGSVSGPAWNAWVSDLLPRRRRGKAFAIRHQRVYPTQFAALLAGGALLAALGSGPSVGALGVARSPAAVSTAHAFLGLGVASASQLVALAFALIFALGLGFKLYSLFHLRAQPDSMEPLPTDALGPLRLLRAGATQEPLRRMILVFAAMGFAIHLSGPFQTAYLLQERGFGYLSLATVTAAMVLSRFAMAPLAGRLIDRRGATRPLLVSCGLMALAPAGWAAAHDVVAFVGVQLVSGVVWTVFDLSVFAYLAECAGVEGRGRAFSLRQLSWSLSAAAGSFVGGVWVTRAGSMESAFWLSSGVRAVAAMLVVGMFLRVRQVRRRAVVV